MYKGLRVKKVKVNLSINEWGWVSYEKLWRSRRVLSIEAEVDDTLHDFHNSFIGYRAESLNLSLGALVLPDVNF